MREQTWFATIVCAIAVIPGFIVGGLMKMLMYVFGGWAEGSDFLYLRAIFGIEAPGRVYEWIFAHAIPSGFQALVAGFVAVWIMEKIAKGAHHALAATIAPHKFTHIFVDTEGKDGPFSGGCDFAELRRGVAHRQIDLGEYRRKKIFPDTFPVPVVGTVYPEGAISIDSETARLAGVNENIQEFFLLSGQHDELKQRDVITVRSEDNVFRNGQVGRRDSSPPTYLQVTLIENVRVADLYREEEQQFRLRELERGLGKELADDDVLKRVEFVRTYGRKIGKNDFS